MRFFCNLLFLTKFIIWCSCIETVMYVFVCIMLFYKLFHSVKIKFTCKYLCCYIHIGTSRELRFPGALVDYVHSRLRLLFPTLLAHQHTDYTHTCHQLHNHSALYTWQCQALIISLINLPVYDPLFFLLVYGYSLISDTLFTYCLFTLIGLCLLIAFQCVTWIYSEFFCVYF